MSHQRYPSIDPKEPHSVSLKVLRLSRPSLVGQHPLAAPLSSKLPSPSTTPLSTPAARGDSIIPASLAYSTNSDTNPDPFLLSPILQLPPSFGSAYVGETFSCTLCANRDVPPVGEPAPSTSTSTLGGGLLPTAAQHQQHTLAKKKFTRDVRIEAEIKTPGSGAVLKLPLLGADGADDGGNDNTTGGRGGGHRGTDLEQGQTLQRIVNFDLKEEGNHVLAVTVSYYEATETSGRSRTFRKLYQFICKGSLIVRTKVGALPDGREGERRWVMEAQLENCSEDVIQLSRVDLNLEEGLRYLDCNWEVSGSPRPVLHPGEVEQCCFVVEETGREAVSEDDDGRVTFGILGIGWRSEMGNKGFLSTGKLSTRAAR
ncbi:hypothetical protein GGS23DRAFT_489333 [Durotheca rogersii]|uniref:uncharacterized protein n=1 Tax=Durotheca rogersii TaxID=419775 RepID=UPI00221E48BD|nr:uncharacterized protein GGS23DRAFT_489333 [Durotheca rogersii]KAI5864238.1 hypothetical protein GGS23DRAFT_489333 [Durotheca rogersii]